uniref:Trafficking kinesin-binding protein 1-like n=1 Tax=Knipowitschia caucasica TaxID=637954 RepID=A0AAV2LK41_KNICA
MLCFEDDRMEQSATAPSLRTTAQRNAIQPRHGCFNVTTHERAHVFPWTPHEGQLLHLNCLTAAADAPQASTAQGCPVSLLPWPQQPPLDPHSAFCLHEGREKLAEALCTGPLPLLLNADGNLRDGEPLCQDVSTITDLCSEIPELEIVSLLSEGQPNYTLRADSVFGYDNDDWLHTPLVPPEVVLGLTCEQIEETFKYFLLCSERLGQVTKTYHDIKAVTHLLEEKERDLELAARIGQSLLKQNQEVTARNEQLDGQLETAKEEIAQLRHELSMRDDLLQFYASTEELENAEARSPLKRSESSSSLSSFVHYDFLQKKLKGLEEENRKLRIETNELTSETTHYEEQEQELMMVCVEELSSVNKQVVDLSEELARRAEDAVRQQEEISSLLAQIVDLQARCKGVTRENEDLTQHLNAARECQLQLKSELKDLQDKYSECEDMLQEAREDIKNLRNKSLPNGTVQRYAALASVLPMDSLAAEIEGTFRKGLDTPAPSEYKSHPRRVFETVKVANRAVKLRSRGQSPALPGSSPASIRSSCTSTPRTSCYGYESFTLEEKPSNNQSLKEDSASGPKRLGEPGTPGGQDLEAALQSLSARQQSHSSDRPFFDVERERKLRALAGNEEVEGSSSFLTPNDSIASSPAASTSTNYSNGSSRHSCSSSGGSRSYLPDRLQIVKPLEGSVTLHQWQQLAKPNLGGILHPRPGVLTKDFRELEVDIQHVYSLNDLEEDEPDMSRVTAAHGPVTSPAPLPPHPILLLWQQKTPVQALSPSIVVKKSNLHTFSLPPRRDFEHMSTSSHTAASPSGVGLVQLLQERGISASVLPQTCTHLPRDTRERCVGKPAATFSWNLVEKLRSLGLHRVAALGMTDPEPPPFNHVIM